MKEKLSPWSAEPDAPGVFIGGTPPASLGSGRAAQAAQMMLLALEETRHDFPNVVRRAVLRRFQEAEQGPPSRSDEE